jgi:D-alanyl-D-alanine carboxypeptidase/D-alanyl-D-alanine-endopeptidase (penicillin-binding protein 4)
MDRMVQVLTAGALLLWPAVPAYAEWSALQVLERNGATVTALALDLDNGTVLQQLNPDRRLTPASLTKLVVAAATLNRWSADKVFETRLLAHGGLHDRRRHSWRSG